MDINITIYGFSRLKNFAHKLDFNKIIILIQ